MLLGILYIVGLFVVEEGGQNRMPLTCLGIGSSIPCRRCVRLLVCESDAR